MALFDDFWKGSGTDLNLMGISFPNTLKEFVDPAGIFHDGGQFGWDVFKWDKESDRSAAEAERIAAAEAAAREAELVEYEDSLKGTDYRAIIYIAAAVVVLYLILKR